MKKESIRNLIIAVLFGSCFSYIFCTQFFDVWSLSLDKGILLLFAVLILTVVLSLLINKFLLRKYIKELSSETFSTLCLLIITLSGILLMVFPFPELKTPDVSRIIVIRPLQSETHPSGDAKILVEEIKINGNPILLKDVKPSSGWQMTTYGLESESGTVIPLVVKNKGELQSDIQILLGKGPLYGAAHIRMGWNEHLFDLFQPENESEISISIPKNTFGFWKLVSFISLWVSLCGILLLLAMLVLPTRIIGLGYSYLSVSIKSVLFWIIISFLFWYGFSFVRIVFLDPSHFMQNGNFLPAIRPIGNDLDLILNASKSVAAGGSPYAGANKYPPAATVFFLPLAAFDMDTAFQILTVFNYVFFFFITIGTPYFLTNFRKLPSFAWFLFATGLFSYGLLFEIERGQFNLIAMGLTLLAILLYHKAPKFRWLAYALFCISVQLKIFPAIFVIFLADDWKDWKNTLVRWIALGLANIALLFILGPGIMQNFIQMITRVLSGIGKSDWPVSHSITGFLMFVNYYFNFPDTLYLTIQMALTSAVLILIGLCFYHAFVRKTILDPYLLLACTLGALLLPTLSNDYTLSYLVGPAIFLFIHLDEKSKEQFETRKSGNKMTIFLIATSAFALTSTYFSYFQKPIILQNQFPALFLFLICATILSFKESRAKLWV